MYIYTKRKSFFSLSYYLYTDRKIEISIKKKIEKDRKIEGKIAGIEYRRAVGRAVKKYI